jgi:hypothetical protein
MRKGSLLATSVFLTCLTQGARVRAEGAADAGASVAAQAQPSADVELGQKLAKVLAEARDEAVRAPAKQAELALSRAGSSQDAGAKARQLAIARAALALAEARVALLRERELLSSTTRRRLEAARRAEQARTLLKQAEQPCPACSTAKASGQP